MASASSTFFDPTIATVIVPIITGSISTLVCGLTAFFAWKQADRTALLQKGIQASQETLRDDFARQAKNDERAYSLRLGKLNPFLEALLETIRHSWIVMIHIENQMGTAPDSKTAISVDFQRRRLFSAKVIQQLEQAAIEISRLQYSVFSSIQTNHLNEFYEILPKTLSTVQVFLKDIYKFTFDEDYLQATQKSHKAFTQEAAALATLVRKALRTEAREETAAEVNALNAEGVVNAFQNVLAELKFADRAPDYLWLAWWIPEDDETRLRWQDEVAMTVSQFEFFCKRVEKVSGTLDFTHNQAMDGNNLKYLMISVKFACEDGLNKFIENLPSLRLESKQLWTGAVKPREMKYSSDEKLAA